MPLDLLIFDCDGVLVDSEPIVNRIESEFFATVGFAVSPQEARRRFQGLTTDQVAAAVEAEIERAFTADELYSWGMMTALGLVESLEPVAGVRNVAERLIASGTPVCVASQSPLPRVRLSLRVADVARLFGENVFTASMVARPKPAPDLFLYAAQRMNAEPSHCAVIEDSPSGVRAACAAGMAVFGYAAEGGAGPDALAAAGAHVFTSMAELPELLARVTSVLHPPDADA